MSAEETKSPYRCVVLKISGNSFASTGERGVSEDETVKTAEEIHAAASEGPRIAVVIGGGNILRGATFTQGNQRNRRIQEATAHYMGMLATVMNGL
ncbi:MAG: UMP kinase, partial [Planctomycetales bacterium]